MVTHSSLIIYHNENFNHKQCVPRYVVSQLVLRHFTNGILHCPEHDKGTMGISYFNYLKLQLFR
jgi:hypothetical protein